MENTSINSALEDMKEHPDASPIIAAQHTTPGQKPIVSYWDRSLEINRMLYRIVLLVKEMATDFVVSAKNTTIELAKDVNTKARNFSVTVNEKAKVKTTEVVNVIDKKQLDLSLKVNDNTKNFSDKVEKKTRQFTFQVGLKFNEMKDATTGRYGYWKAVLEETFAPKERVTLGENTPKDVASESPRISKRFTLFGLLNYLSCMKLLNLEIPKKEKNIT